MDEDLKTRNKAGNAARKPKPESGGDWIQAVLQQAGTLFVFWEISRYRKVVLENGPGHSGGKLALRIHDVTGIRFDGGNSLAHMDIPVPAGTSHWKIAGLRQNCRYITDIGLLMGQDRFIPILRSEHVHTPEDPEGAQKHSGASLWKQCSGEGAGWLEDVSTYTIYERQQGGDNRDFRL
ncbi:DUF4912 domain-containing protein [Peribacillus sp. SCS-37]|uniref:DUF4912 domain-containing protein n=1 Tax=Paraperibacillus esterisolvens TaxID=3115296 RepID=UPI003905BCB3